MKINNRLFLCLDDLRHGKILARHYNIDKTSVFKPLLPTCTTLFFQLLSLGHMTLFLKRITLTSKHYCFYQVWVIINYRKQILHFLKIRSSNNELLVYNYSWFSSDFSNGCCRQRVHLSEAEEWRLFQSKVTRARLFLFLFQRECVSMHGVYINCVCNYMYYLYVKIGSGFPSGRGSLKAFLRSAFGVLWVCGFWEDIQWWVIIDHPHLMVYWNLDTRRAYPNSLISHTLASF